MAYTQNTSGTTQNGILEALTDIGGGVLPGRTVSSATIANGENLSGAVDLGDKTMTGIVMPAAWTAAVLTFAVSADGVTYNPLYDEDGSEVTETVAASRAIRLDPAQWAGWRYVKIRSGTAAAPVAQGAERIVQIVSRAV